ncbi:8-oxo-dGTP pyrophosphatase MutT, NUDIX family [Cohaesibacter sp. ES.047]|uniref:CoA pyrophosphatase n=1 Tax=Cohaesibacter sp. ES.047 TaxID=1798205 RepID=UPI000BB6C9AD|nr:CoA pyrophosphatase [Cohaesibacter sp. ES.047]SNY91479.1 8-oxo-dGTP pyrophosphatase MutT, NUDIX family [Cohaesibacter sp. ES.047]
MNEFSAQAFRQRVEAALQSAGGVAGEAQQLPIKDLAWREGEVVDLRDAAVLIPIVDRGPDVEASVILTQRTHHLPSHAGQVAFPGGKLDDEDVSSTAAALREAWEEIGLRSDYVCVFGEMRPYISSTGYRIFPILSTLQPGFELQANPEEVDEIFEVPLSFLMNAANHRRESAEWRGKLRHYIAMPYNDYYIWGVTAGILHNLYETVYRL